MRNFSCVGVARTSGQDAARSLLLQGVRQSYVTVVDIATHQLTKFLTALLILAVV